jgi:hypothetical protein
VQSTSIGMPGGNACEGVCTAAGVMAVEGCEWRNENSMHGRVGYVVSVGAECAGEHLEAKWKASLARWLRSRHRAALNQPSKSLSCGLSVPDSAILS